MPDLALLERTSAQIKAEIEARFGFFPPFFEPAYDSPAVLENLWQQTIVAYVDNPLPAIFKEKLFAYLSRYCSVPYCLICHSCALSPLGLTAKQILDLITEPTASTKAVSNRHITWAEQAEPLTQFPEDSEVVQELYEAAIAIFLHPSQTEPLRQALRRLLGNTDYAYLTLLLAYIRLCHQWVESYPELAYSVDRRAQEHLAALLQAEPALADFFTHYTEKVREEQKRREDQLAAEIAKHEQTELALRESEERLRLILQNMPVMLDAFDEQGNIIIWNQECERITGYGTEEIIGNPQAMSWLYPDVTYRQQMVTAWTERGNDYRGWEWDLVCKDGSRRTVAWSNISDRFPIPGWMSWGIGVDVTDRKQAENALRDSELQFRSLSASSPIGIYLTRTDGYTTYTNPRCQEIFGFTLEESLGDGWLEWVHPDDRECLFQAWHNTIATGAPYLQDYRVQRREGSVRWVQTRAAPMHSDDDALIGYVGTVEDMTDRKRAEDALRASEAQFRSLSACSPVGIYLANPEGYSTYTNPRCQEIFGFTLGESIGGGWADRVHSDDREWVFQEWSAAAAAGKAYTAEYRVQLCEGVVRWVQTRSAAMYSDAGLLTGHVGTIEDITDRKQAEHEIRQLNQALEQQNLALEALVEQRTAELMTFIDTLPDYIFVVERDAMRMSFCNDSIARLIGWENRHQVAGKTIFECYAPDIAATFAAQNEQVFESGEMLHFQETYTTPLGTLNFDTYKIPLKKPNGEVYALIGSSRDITELVAARQKLSDRTVQLEMVNRELESFSYSVSHDLRAPLRHIGGFVTALTDRLQQNGHLTDPTTAHYLQIIQDSSHKMGALIDGLLTLSRVGRRQMTGTLVDLNQLVAAVLAQRPEVTTTSTTETVSSTQLVQFSIGALPTVKGDATLLQQVFVNLLDNAIKFSRHHQPAYIEIGALSDGIIFVRDRGVGFQMKYADQLFGAFQRLHSQSEFEGSGIGLAIVQRIIHRHRGDIWVESQPDQGATFYFTLGDRPEQLGQAK